MGDETDSPHHLVMLHKILQHASEQGQKEAECGLPRPPTWIAKAGP